MEIKHLFIDAFGLNHSLIFKAGPEGREQAQSAEVQKLTPEEMRKELEAVARRHLDSARNLVRETEENAQITPLSKKAEQYLAKVKENVARLERALASGRVNMRTLQDSQASMAANVGSGLRPHLERSTDRDDPLGTGGMLSYNERDFSTRVGRTETVNRATEGVLRSALMNTEYGTRTASSVNVAMDAKFDREMTELAAARQLQRNRGELPREADANLALARELTDTMRLYKAAEAGRYVQEKPEAVLRRQARLTERLLRQAGALNLAPGAVADLGLVMIQRSKEGQAYLLTVAEGGRVDGQSIAIPASTVIDLGFEQKRETLQARLNDARGEATKAEQVLDRDYANDQARTRWENATAKVERLQQQIDELEPASFDDFRGRPEQRSNQVAERMKARLDREA